MKTNQNVIISGNRVISGQNFSTPGVYKIFKTIPNSFYELEWVNVVKGKGDIAYWISDEKKNTLYFDDFPKKLIRTSGNIINVGILFRNNVELDNFFEIEDIKIKFQRRNNIQLKTSNSIKYFDKFMQRKYNLLHYKSDTLPTIFFGCYTKTDINYLNNHKGKKILLWGGTDTTKNYNIEKVKKMKNIIHIAQSHYIVKDLMQFNINSKYIPIAPTVNYNYKTVSKGPCIYIYTNPNNQDFYGKKLYSEIMKYFAGIKFYLACNSQALISAKEKGVNCKGIKSYSKFELMKIYSDCFIALRLTEHDGISASIQELGLMGIKTIHNGITPSCLKYKSLNDIKQLIIKEKSTIGQFDHDLSSKVKQFLKDGDRHLIQLLRS
tara:strand:- start:6684 stop:7820 length:1137 start_codon:yes stop_codon:yes gene_type:complete